jgi:hypothetical protein
MAPATPIGARCRAAAVEAVKGFSKLLRQSSRTIRSLVSSIWDFTGAIVTIGNHGSMSGSGGTLPAKNNRLCYWLSRGIEMPRYGCRGGGQSGASTGAETFRGSGLAPIPGRSQVAT